MHSPCKRKVVGANPIGGLKNVRFIQVAINYSVKGVVMSNCIDKDGWKLAQIKAKDTVAKRISHKKEQYLEDPVKCKHCGIPIQYEKRNTNKFCNHSCSAAFNNKGVVRNGVSHGFCIECGSKCKRKLYKFCSIKCQHKYQYDDYIAKWLSGELVITSEASNTRLRKHLIEKYNNKCSRCGWCEINPKTGNVPLQVEHIDGNSTNNLPCNLTLLCPNCHSLTPTFGALNIGNGRHYRRVRYEQGKSY